MYLSYFKCSIAMQWQLYWAPEMQDSSITAEVPLDSTGLEIANDTRAILLRVHQFLSTPNGKLPPKK